MRYWIDLVNINESIVLPWGLGNAGCWILPDGEVIPCDYEGDVHHGDIAANMLDYDSNDIDLDEFAKMGVDHGWVRIRMTQDDFCLECDPSKITRRQLSLIPRIEDGNHTRYILEKGWPHATFPSMGKLMLALRAMISHQDTPAT